MKKLLYLPLIMAVFILTLAATSTKNKNNYGLSKGSVALKSVSAISFGPEGILLIGDSKSATIFAVDTKDNNAPASITNIEIKNLDQKIAAVLGTEAKNIQIQDIAVNPVSKKIYCAVQTIDGTPVLLTVAADKITPVQLNDVMFSAATISNAPSADSKDRGGRSLRDYTISDIQFADGSVMVSGLSNQEFASAFRKINFPFTDKQDHATLEIFHAAHGKYETNAPIRTFTTAELNGKKFLVASYTCTPLVLFPLDELKAGKHVKGRTVAEFGAGNAPLDMITISKNGSSVLLLSNSNRPMMRVKYSNIAEYQGALTDPIKESFGTAGVAFVNLPVVNVLQMDKIDDNKVIVLQRKSNGDLDLITLNEWLLS